MVLKHGYAVRVDTHCRRTLVMESSDHIVIIKISCAAYYSTSTLDQAAPLPCYQFGEIIQGGQADGQYRQTQ